MEVLEAPPPGKTALSMDLLYEKAFPNVAKFVSKMGGTLEDAKDIFHDAFVIYFEKQEQDVLEIDIAAEAYVLGIARHLWIRRFNFQKHNVRLDESEQRIQIPEDDNHVSTSRLLSLLETAGKKCLELLHAFYFDQSSVSQIKKMFGFTSEHSASVQKYKCIEKLRDTLHTKHLSHESFFE